MAQPVVHFEIIGKDPEQLRNYYGDLFGWQFDTPSPVAEEVSDPDSYGFLDLVATEDGTGIRGGIGGGPSFHNHAVFSTRNPKDGRRVGRVLVRRRAPRPDRPTTQSICVSSSFAPHARE